MINIRNIIRVLMIIMFICAFSENAFCQLADVPGYTPPSFNLPSEYGNNTSQCPEGQYWSSPDNTCRPKKTNSSSSSTKSSGVNTPQDASFCGADKGVFKELVVTGQMIFNRLRDLIYVVAGFGIIAIAVGGFFGNMNWKWLSAIVISLVLIASAGEFIILLTGCEQYGTTLITNTLQAPAEETSVKPDMVDVEK